MTAPAGECLAGAVSGVAAQSSEDELSDGRLRRRQRFPNRVRKFDSCRGHCRGLAGQLTRDLRWAAATR